MNVIVAGGGRLGADLAVALAGAGHEVTLVATGGAEPLPPGPGTVRTMAADPLDPAGLEAAGALRADVLVACTPADHDNLAAAALARRRFDVPRVVALVNDPEHAWLFDESWGVDAAVSSSVILGSLVAEVEAARP